MRSSGAIEWWHLGLAVAQLAQARRPVIWGEFKNLVHRYAQEWEHSQLSPDEAVIRWLQHPRSYEYRVWQIFEELQDLLLEAIHRREIVITVAQNLTEAVPLMPRLLQVKLNEHGDRIFPFDFGKNQVEVAGQRYLVTALSWVTTSVVELPASTGPFALSVPLAPPSGASSGRKRGRRSEKGQQAEAQMRAELRSGKITPEQLSHMLEKELLSRYGGSDDIKSRDTVRKARNRIFAEKDFIDKSRQ